MDTWIFTIYSKQLQMLQMYYNILKNHVHIAHLHVKPFQVLINILKSLKHTVSQAFSGRLFHTFAANVLTLCVPCVTVLVFDVVNICVYLNEYADSRL
jgi:hypothetical protein